MSSEETEEVVLGDGESEDTVTESFYLNFTGKLMLAAIGSWLAGKLTNIKLRGSKREVKVVADAMVASRKFQDELKKPGATVKSVIDKLGVKHMTEREFERVFKVKWPL